MLLDKTLISNKIFVHRNILFLIKFDPITWFLHVCEINDIIFQSGAIMVRIFIVN